MNYNEYSAVQKEDSVCPSPGLLQDVTEDLAMLRDKDLRVKYL